MVSDGDKLLYPYFLEKNYSKAQVARKQNEKNCSIQKEQVFQKYSPPSLHIHLMSFSNFNTWKSVVLYVIQQVGAVQAPRIIEIAGYGNFCWE